MPFLSYLAFGTPESDHKRVRLKLVLFLQGSALYDVDAVLARVGTGLAKSILALETAILYARVCFRFGLCWSCCSSYRFSSKSTRRCSRFWSANCKTRLLQKRIAHWVDKSYRPKSPRLSVTAWASERGRRWC